MKHQKIIKTILTLIIFSILILPVSAAFPNYNNIYTLADGHVRWTHANETALCNSLGKTPPGTGIYSLARKVQGGGSSTNICNANGYCISSTNQTGDIPLTTAEMQADWAGSYRYYYIYAYCSDSSTNLLEVYNMVPDYPPSPPSSGPGINFTASPRQGFIPLLATFAITTNITPSIVKWNFGDGTITNTTTSSQNASHTYTSVGLYTVRLDTYDSTYGWQNYTRYDYISAVNPSGVVFNVDIKDSISGALIQDAGFGVKNTTTGVWRNSTSPTGLLYVDSTDPGYLYPLSINQTITIAANKTGYGSASKTFRIPYDNYREYLYLVPSTVVNATGAGTVVATVVSNAHGTPISGTSVSLDTQYRSGIY